MKNGNDKKRTGFGGFLYGIFVHNIGYKIFAIAFGALIWLLTVGL